MHACATKSARMSTSQPRRGSMKRPRRCRCNHTDLILRSIAKRCVSKDGCKAGARGHPSRRAHRTARALPGERAPQDEVGDLFYAPLSRVTTFVRGLAPRPRRSLSVIVIPKGIEAAPANKG